MIKKFFYKIKDKIKNMRRNRKYLYASVFLGGILLLFVLFLYISTDSSNSEIILPNQDTAVIEKIKYENNKVLKDIEITSKNYKEIIEKLIRPSVYSMSVLNEVYAFDDKKSQITSVSVTKEYVTAIRDGTEYTLVNDLIYIEKNEQIKQYNHLDFTADEIMGIPSYEQILEIDDNVEILQTTYNNEQALQIKVGNSQIYTISLSTGMLMRYELYEDENLVRNVSIANLVITEG